MRDRRVQSWLQSKAAAMPCRPNDSEPSARRILESDKTVTVSYDESFERYAQDGADQYRLRYSRDPARQTSGSAEGLAVPRNSSAGTQVRVLLPSSAKQAASRQPSSVAPSALG